MLTPNLFTYATKELSQDAFLCWLAAWADPKYASNEPEMHHCAHQFVIWLLRRGGIFEVDNIESLEIKQQYYSIDILMIVNNEYKILIEDKVHSGQHSDQLQRYLAKLVDDENTPLDKIAPIYLKTGHPESGEFFQAKADGYSVIMRRDLLDVLASGKCEDLCHPLFKDFYRHLEQLEEEMNAWETTPISIWSNEWAAWIGFFSKVYTHFSNKFKNDEHGWGYVPNPNGGFMGYWVDCGQSLHMHLQQDSLCIRVWEPNKEQRSQTRDNSHAQLIKKAKELGLSYSKPARFGCGEYMTVAIRNDGYLSAEKDGTLNFDETLANIEEALYTIENCNTL